MSVKTQILTNSQVEKIITRMAYEVYERNFNLKTLIIAAINGRGEKIAELIDKKIKEISSIKTQLVTVSINKENPIDTVFLKDAEKLKLANHVVLLVDDVLNTGRTLIYGALPFLKSDIKSLQTLVLVNRNHNLFPVKADYIGLNLRTTLQEHITVTVERNKINVYVE
ncbi:MAG: phosphoribosyltransferase family protein [Bacteroidia bacterium]